MWRPVILNKAKISVEKIRIAGRVLFSTVKYIILKCLIAGIRNMSRLVPDTIHKRSIGMQHE